MCSTSRDTTIDRSAKESGQKCGRLGFDDAEHAGRDLIQLIDRGSVRKTEVRSALVGTLSASQLGLPLFTLALGLLDGFNPCAMWVLLFLLSQLVRLRDRRRMALVAGTFVLVSGAVILLRPEWLM